MPRLCWVAFAAAVMSGPLAAQVPPDAAAFAHVNVAKLWAGPGGEQLRAAKVPEIDRAVAEFAAATGLTPADVTSATIYWPDLRKADGPGVEPFVLTLTLTKPIDAGRLVAFASLGCRASGDRVSHTFEKGVLTLRHSPYYPEAGVLVRKFEEIVLDLSDALHPRLAVHVPAPRAAKATDPLTPAFVAAAGDFAVGINTARLPWRWRAEGVVPDAKTRPIMPILADGLWSVAGEVTADALTVEARFRGGDAAAAPDREKALRAARALLSTRLGDSHARAGRPTDPKGDPAPPVPEVVAVLAGLRASLDAATTRVDGPDAVATLAVRADLPFGPALAASVAEANADAARLLATQTNLKQLALAMYNYASGHNDHLPAPSVASKAGEPLLSWRVAVLPDVGKLPLYYQFKLDEPWDSEHNAKVLKDNPMPPAFALPGVTKPGDKETHFRVFVGGGAVFEPLKPTKLAAFAGDMSNTVLVATAATAVPWTKPDELAYDPKASGADLKKLLLLAGDGCTVGMCDGTTRFVPGGIDEATLKYLITRKPAK